MRAGIIASVICMCAKMNDMKNLERLLADIEENCMALKAFQTKKLPMELLQTVMMASAKAREIGRSMDSDKRRMYGINKSLSFTVEDLRKRLKEATGESPAKMSANTQAPEPDSSCKRRKISVGGEAAEKKTESDDADKSDENRSDDDISVMNAVSEKNDSAA